MDFWGQPSAQFSPCPRRTGWMAPSHCPGPHSHPVTVPSASLPHGVHLGQAVWLHHCWESFHSGSFIPKCEGPPVPLSWDLTCSFLGPGEGQGQPGSVASPSGNCPALSWAGFGWQGPPAPGEAGSGPHRWMRLCLPGFLRSDLEGLPAACRPNLWPACVPAPGPFSGLQSSASWQGLSYNYLSPLAEIAVTPRTGCWLQSRKGGDCFPGPENRGQACRPGKWAVPFFRLPGPHACS